MFIVSTHNLTLEKVTSGTRLMAPLSFIERKRKRETNLQTWQWDAVVEIASSDEEVDQTSQQVVVIDIVSSGEDQEGDLPNELNAGAEYYAPRKIPKVKKHIRNRCYKVVESSDDEDFFNIR